MHEEGTLRCEDCIKHFERLGMGQTCCKCEGRISVDRDWSVGWSWLPDTYEVYNAVGIVKPQIIIFIMPFFCLYVANITLMSIALRVGEINYLLLLNALCMMVHLIDCVQQCVHCKMRRIQHWFSMAIVLVAQVPFHATYVHSRPWCFEDECSTIPLWYQVASACFTLLLLADACYYARLMYVNNGFSRALRIVLPIRQNTRYRRAS